VLTPLLRRVGILDAARAAYREGELFADGLRSAIRRNARRDFTSPRVGRITADTPPQMPVPAEGDLRAALHALHERYAQVPAFRDLVSPHWQSEPAQIDLSNLRAHGGYLWTGESDFRYRWTARYIRKRDRLHLLRLLREDDAFGCPTLESHGTLISRDKLDSILEIYYLIDSLNLSMPDRLNVLDIGAGYGRLAHRFTTVFPHSHYYCVDAVPLSTVMSRFYLQYRCATRASVIPFDCLDELRGRTFDFAINVHSFPEQTKASIDYWLSLLDDLRVNRLVIVDHNGQWLTMEQPDNRRSCYLPLLAQHGWTMLDARPKFPDLLANAFGIYPEAVYATFART
jgi:SAM-dependent methyltransferase